MSEEPLLDRGHLMTQTGGDEALAAELLDLFAEQCRRILPELADASRSATDRADLAHTLKGSALGVGAGRVANLASALEDRLRSGRPVDASVLPTLERAVAATFATIKRPFDRP